MATEAFRVIRSLQHAPELCTVPQSHLLASVNVFAGSIPKKAIFRQKKYCLEFASGFPNCLFIIMTDSEWFNGTAFMT